jgi:membrane associated rhomboid family serine protease
MRRSSSPDLGELLTFGGRVPAVVGGLIAGVVLASLVGALTGGRLFQAAALVPALVYRGEVWRLATWAFLHNEPVGLIFACLILFQFGRDLSYAWGPRRFAATFLGLSVGAAVVTCLLALAWPPLMVVPALGSWPPVLALIVAWAMIFPERQLMFWMVLPMSGRSLLWVTLGGTVFFMAFRGVATYVPELSAELLMIALASGWSPRGLWQSLRIKAYERRARRRASHLKVVKKDPPHWMN